MSVGIKVVCTDGTVYTGSGVTGHFSTVGEVADTLKATAVAAGKVVKEVLVGNADSQQTNPNKPSFYTHV